MRNFTVQKSDFHKVACVEEIPEGAKTIVIAVHGFTSSKESPTVRRLLDRLPAAGIGVVGIDLPGHGTEDSFEEELRLEACIDSLAAAEWYVNGMYPKAEICYFASSFGAYVTSLYISSRHHKGHKAFFRSAAVNMPSLFLKDDPTEEEKRLFEELEEKGYFEQGFGLGKPVRVTRGFIEDLAAHDLFALFDPDVLGPHKIAMAHGAVDAVIDPEMAARFAERFHITETVFPGEGHSLSDHPETPDRVVDLAIRLYQEEFPAK